MKIMNAKRVSNGTSIDVFKREKLKYLHRININVPVPIHAVKKFQCIKTGKAFAIDSASLSNIINIPSLESIRYSDNGKFISRSNADKDAIRKAKAKYQGANIFRIIPARGTL